MKIVYLISFIILAVALSASGTSAKKPNYVDLLIEYEEIVEKYNELTEKSGAPLHIGILNFCVFLQHCEVIHYRYALPYFARKTLERIMNKFPWSQLFESSKFLLDLSDDVTGTIAAVNDAVRNQSQELGDQLQQCAEQLKRRGMMHIEITIKELLQIFESNEFQEIFELLPEAAQELLIKLYEELVHDEGFNFITDAISKISNSKLVTEIRELIAAAKQSIGAAKDFAILKLKKLLDGQSFKDTLSSLGTNIQAIVLKGIAKVTELASSASERVNNMVATALTQTTVLIEAFKTYSKEITDKLQQGLDKLNEKIIAVQEQGRDIILQVIKNGTVQKLLENMSPEVQDAAKKLLESLA